MDISKSELDVMRAIWQQHPCSAQEVIDRLNQEKDWHEKTVKTLLSRLVKKGALSFEKEQRRYLYIPLIEKETYRQAESQSLLNKLFGGKVSPLIAGYANQQKIDKDDIAELKKFIADWEQDND